MDQATKDQIAQEKFGRKYDELDSREKQSVAGTYGGNKRKEEMTEAAGGDTSKAYSEMSQTNKGESREGGNQ